MTLEKYRYIVVEGPIGAGKTSLAQRMADRLNGALLLEKPDENPFLEKFYDDIRRHALPTQLFFFSSAQINYRVLCKRICSPRLR